ncbi:MAG: aldo/keto reductase [Bacteroidia bacterium]|nr:aldo/keto reductase [Bacteroidia bacterium]
MGKIALGTVQFGLNYGINNSGGQIPEDEVGRILELAAQGGIEVLDTAAAYGNSEDVLGKSLTKLGKSFKIVSKLAPGSKADFVKTSFSNSLQKLNQESLHGFLIHHFQNLKDDPQIWPEMRKLQQSGKVKRVGISLYHPHEAEFLWKQGIDFQIVQVPYSIFDQRFEKVFPEMKKRGVEIHVRSVFLQGLFFKNPAQLPAHFQSVKNKIDRLQHLARSNGFSIADLCLGFALNNSFIDQVVIGVDSLKNLEENLAVNSRLESMKVLEWELKGMSEENEGIILPVNWVLD